MFWRRCQHSLVVQATVIVFVFAAVEQSCAGQSSDSVNVTAPKVESVFPQPSSAELAEITQPKLRVELLKMVHDDQVARKTGT